MNSDQIPKVIQRYQAAHDRRDTKNALLAFSPRAHVADDGRDYRGSDEIEVWLSTAASEFTYTREFVGADEVAPGNWLIRNHIEGDFPGGVADLRYQFTIANNLITDLVIAP